MTKAPPESPLTLEEFQSRSQDLKTLCSPDWTRDVGRGVNLKPYLEKEIEFHRTNPNQVFLYRGTAGLKVDSQVALDSALLDKSNRSLSYGVSMLGGFYGDAGACAQRYCGGENAYGYMLGFDFHRYINNNDHIRDFFYIPAYGPLGRLFLSGEYFHARSAVSSKVKNKNQTIRGVSDLSYKSYEDYEKCGYLTLPDLTPVEVAAKIDQYIADNSSIISFPWGKRDESQWPNILTTQKHLAATLATKASRASITGGNVRKSCQISSEPPTFPSAQIEALTKTVNPILELAAP